MAGELSLKTPLTGLVTLVPTNTATDKTITLPATTGTMVVQDGTNTTTINNLAYTGTLTGGTGVVNIGSGQVYKDASGNLGVGTASPTQILEVAKTGASYIRARSTDSAFTGVDFGQAGSGEGRIIVRDSQPLSFYTAATEKMKLDSSGNLGLGVTPSAWSSGGNITTGTNKSISSSTDGINLGSNWYYNAGDKFAGTGYASFYQQTGGSHIWKTSTASGTAGNAISFTQAMTLTAAGDLLVGVTATGTPSVGYILNSNGFLQIGRASGASQSTMGFYNGGTFVGEIRTSTTATQYLTSSDYRLKENVAPMQNALATVVALKPCTYTWKANGSAGQGFIAHELQAVVPDCVTGKKDAVDEDGKPKYQGVDTSFLVATLTAAIQELTARLEVLENK